MISHLVLFTAGLMFGVNLQKMERVPIPADGVGIAATDVAKLAASGENTSFVRYIWIPSADKEAYQVTVFAINFSMNRTPILASPPSLTDGKSQVVRVDLRYYASKKEDLEDLVKQWDLFLNREPYFTVAVTEKNSAPTPPPKEIKTKERVRVKVKPYRASDGKTYDYKFEERIVTKIVPSKTTVVEIGKEVRVIGPHVGVDAAKQLLEFTKTDVPIVRFDWFIRTALSTLEDGVYYELRGIKESAKKDRTDLQEFLIQFGADEDLVKKLGTDNRVATFRSQVTGKPRAVEFFRGAGGRPVVNTGLVTITQDIKDNNIDPDKHPLLNLLEFKFDASEVILESSNGLQVTALFNGEGKLQRSVPDDVAIDTTIPAPHTRRLQPSIGCIRCHSLQDSDGYRSVRNDVLKLLSGRIDIFGERKFKDSPDFEILNSLAGKYTGDITKPLRRARDDFSEAALRATKGLTYAKVAAGTGETYQHYWYDEVTPEVACLELGIKVKGVEESVQVLNAILPPDLSDIDRHIVPEHGFIAALKSGISVNRQDFEQVYGYAAVRVIERLKNVPAEAPKNKNSM